MESPEKSTDLVSIENITSAIHSLRGQRVMLDEDLAKLYGVETKRLNEQVKRNLARFPEDFMFQLSNEEWTRLKSQIATSNTSESLKSQSVISNERGGRRTPPYAFTQEGVAMLSGVLNSDRAIQVNIEIMRVFVRVRNAMSQHDELASRLMELDERLNSRLRKHDTQIVALFEALRRLMTRPKEVVPRRPIGFQTEECDDK